jgi:hypothetical protein
MLGMAPPPGLAAAIAAAKAQQAPAAPPPEPVYQAPAPQPGRRPSPIPEDAAPDSKSEYAPPRALPAAQRTMLGMSPPVSVDAPSSAADSAPFTAMTAQAYEPDVDSTKLDTIPPRRRQAGARRIVFGVMGVALALVVAVGFRQLMKGSSETSAPAPTPTRAEAVAAKPPPPAPEPAPAPNPERPTTEVAAPSAEEEQHAAAVEAVPAETENEKPAAGARHSTAEPPTSRVAHAPKRAAAPPPHTEKKTTTRAKEPGKTASPPPSPGGGSIVRESPF